MGEMQEPFVVALIPTMFGKVVSNINWPLYLVNPDKVDEFKSKWDKVTPGLEWVPIVSVCDLRGPFPGSVNDRRGK